VTTNFDQVDFFSDASLLDDPYPYFEHLRSKCPVTPLPHHGVVAVSGHEEATDVYRNAETFSSCNSVIGPFATFPEPLEGDDVSPIIERYRHQLPMNEHMVTMDPPQHTQERALLMRLITPKRLKQNEEFMWRLADRQLDELLDDGRCEFISAYSKPFAMLAVADLLGVPESEHQRFREGFGLSASPGELGGTEGPGLNALDWLDDYFATYVEDRRRQPRKDVLTDLALATYPDGSTPDVTAVVRSATFLFAAGQETTARLLATAMRYLCEYPQLQDELREHRERIPDFIEETLRIESPVKADFRLARRATTVGGVEIRPGTPVMLLNGAANRDPRRFECPAEFRLDRANAKEHIAFGRGAHACPGGPLARAEGRISLERILDRMRNIRLSEEHHGPAAAARHFEYEPTWVLRGLRQIHIEFTPAHDERRRATSP
jgi:cytochrome P450